MKSIFDNVARECSKIVTHSYSTSFSLGIRFLHPSIQHPIYNIYGMVRFADEIVDTFHDYEKESLLDRFEKDTFMSIEEGISLNPILNSFQETVNKYDIDLDLVRAFFKSMRMDLNKTEYTREQYEDYIYGSADVVGLMCLIVFVNGDKSEYERLKASAMKLGSAFQKVNFLRDLQADFQGLDRIYFPNVSMSSFDDSQKQIVIKEIEQDFEEAYEGLIQLPKNARFGVYMAYVYYLNLLKKIKKVEASKIMETRIRVPDYQKYNLFLQSYVKNSLNLI